MKGTLGRIIHCSADTIGSCDLGNGTVGCQVLTAAVKPHQIDLFAVGGSRKLEVCTLVIFDDGGNRPGFCGAVIDRVHGSGIGTGLTLGIVTGPEKHLGAVVGNDELRLGRVENTGLQRLAGADTGSCQQLYLGLMCQPLGLTGHIGAIHLEIAFLQRQKLHIIHQTGRCFADPVIDPVVFPQRLFIACKQ